MFIRPAQLTRVQLIGLHASIGRNQSVFKVSRGLFHDVAWSAGSAVRGFIAFVGKARRRRSLHCGTGGARSSRCGLLRGLDHARLVFSIRSTGSHGGLRCVWASGSSTGLCLCRASKWRSIGLRCNVPFASKFMGRAKLKGAIADGTLATCIPSADSPARLRASHRSRLRTRNKPRPSSNAPDARNSRSAGAWRAAPSNTWCKPSSW